MTTTPSPFHRGEQAVQERQGVRKTMESWGRKVIRGYLPEQHRAFYAEQPFVVAAARDLSDRPWVTLLSGQPGFLTSPTPATMEFVTTLPSSDPLRGALTAAADLGLLGIDLATRRRNRVNGTISATHPGGFTLDVGQTFGNCPQYISERHWHPVDGSNEPAEDGTRARELTPAMQRWIATADTFFIGSGIRDETNGDANGLDASHRGGPAGFVQVKSPTELVFPDYAGNNHFNTIGNLVVDPRVGLLFVDFEHGSLLQITGRARIDWDSPAILEHGGAQRLVSIDIDAIVLQENILPMRFSAPASMVRELRLVERQQESDDVVAFYFDSRDDGELPNFEAGQHVPLEFSVDGVTAPVTRTYSLSNGPGQGFYRISVKREPDGLVSRFLHDQLAIGGIINSRTPAGDFVLPPGDRPVVLLSAGVGITPTLSMLHALTDEPSERPVAFIHGARNSRQHAHATEVRRIADSNPNVRTVTAYSQPLPDDRAGEQFDVRGRIDSDTVRDAVDGLQADYFLCGPAAFLGAMTDLLAGLGVDDARIHIEQF
jgi:ferredoxin-NADP reductase/predicted pyridoxine 5'-phosphate oxidase superfamily flavin-nucleotide-binding protein